MTGEILQGRPLSRFWPKSFVTQMLTGDLLAAADLLVTFIFYVLLPLLFEFSSSVTYRLLLVITEELFK